MSVRAVHPDELPDVAAVMHALWSTPDPYDFSDESVFVWQRDDASGLGVFVSFSIRPWAEGCESSPVPYIEGCCRGGVQPPARAIRLRCEYARRRHVHRPHLFCSAQRQFWRRFFPLDALPARTPCAFFAHIVLLTPIATVPYSPRAHIEIRQSVSSL